MDLNYRREILGITQKELARLLGRSVGTIVRWSSTSLEHPPWLTDWMEYMEMEIACGVEPRPLPRSRKAIEAILYPCRAKAKRQRAPNGSRAALLATRDANRTRRQQQRENHARMGCNLQTQQPATDPMAIVDALRAKKIYTKDQK
jgi:hypothetical protein